MLTFRFRQMTMGACKICSAHEVLAADIRTHVWIPSNSKSLVSCGSAPRIGSWGQEVLECMDGAVEPKWSVPSLLSDDPAVGGV